MWFQNKLDRLAPNLANAGSAAKRKLKGWHPAKQIVTWGRQLLRRVSKAKVSVDMKSEAWGAHLPRIPLSFRSATESKAINILVGGAFDARSEEGIELHDQNEAEQLGAVDGVEVDTVEVPVDPADNKFQASSEKVEGGVPQTRKVTVLKTVKKKALKERKARMDRATKRFLKKDARYAQAVVQNKPMGRIEELQKDLIDLEAEKNKAQEEYATLRRMANRLKFKEMGERFGNAYAVRVLEGVKVKASAIDPNAFDVAIHGARRNIIRTWEKAAALDLEIAQIAEEHKAWVYEDVIDFVEGSKFKTLVGAKSKHQIISGTTKLASATGGFTERLPGLEYYMEAAKDKYRQFERPNSQIRRALEMMRDDWLLFKPGVQEQIGLIREDSTEAGKGWFDADRMADYVNMQAYMATLTKIGAMLDDPSEEGLSGLLSTFGENINLGYGRTPEEREKYRADMVERYGLPEDEFETVAERMEAAGVEPSAGRLSPDLESIQQTKYQDPGQYEQQSQFDPPSPRSESPLPPYEGSNTTEPQQTPNSSPPSLEDGNLIDLTDDEGK